MIELAVVVLIPCPSTRFEVFILGRQGIAQAIQSRPRKRLTSLGRATAVIFLRSVRAHLLVRRSASPTSPLHSSPRCFLIAVPHAIALLAGTRFAREVSMTCDSTVLMECLCVDKHNGTKETPHASQRGDDKGC